MRYGKYLTRKDFHHEYKSGRWYPIKSYRAIGNNKVRLYKGEITNGGVYKKIYDVQWIAS